MSEFWIVMAPWLVMAVALPTAIALYFKVMPSGEWAQSVIEEWADSEGLRIAAIDEVRLFGVAYFSSYYRVFRVRVLDKKGLERDCKAVVGHTLLGQTYPNLSINWIKPR